MWHLGELPGFQRALQSTFRRLHSQLFGMDKRATQICHETPLLTRDLCGPPGSRSRHLGIKSPGQIFARRRTPSLPGSHFLLSGPIRCFECVRQRRRETHCDTHVGTALCRGGRVARAELAMETVRWGRPQCEPTDIGSTYAGEVTMDLCCICVASSRLPAATTSRSSA